MKKALFIDRDGTVIAEPPADYQVDSLEKLEFIPGAISALRTLRGLDFELVMATNQDGLGTEAFPEEDFRPPHEKMLRTLAGEGVAFDDMLIDRTFESDDAPTRKPRTGMFGRYTDGSYDLGASYVVGDRATDILLARNLGAKGILLAPAAEGRRMLREAGAEEACVLITDSWAEIAEYIRRGERRVVVTRETRETRITVRIDLDGRGFGTCGAAPGDGISTGLRFLDHMLAQIAHHGGVSLTVEAHGDLDIDEHHTMEDVAIVLGEAIDRALGSKAGIGRYGFALPMDDCQALVLLDFGGRIDFEWDAEFRRERSGTSRRRCSATSSTRSAARHAATCRFRRAAGTTTTRPRRSSRLSRVRCAWPWHAPASDTTYPAAKAYYDSDHGLRYGQPAFGSQCPAAHRRRIYGHVRRHGAAAGGQGAPPGRG